MNRDLVFYFVILLYFKKLRYYFLMSSLYFKSVSDRTDFRSAVHAYWFFKKFRFGHFLTNLQTQFRHANPRALGYGLDPLTDTELSPRSWWTEALLLWRPEGFLKWRNIYRFGTNSKISKQGHNDNLKVFHFNRESKKCKISLGPFVLQRETSRKLESLTFCDTVHFNILKPMKLIECSLQGCGSGSGSESAWIRIHFPSWIRIRIWLDLFFVLQVEALENLLSRILRKKCLMLLERLQQVNFLNFSFVII